MIERQALVDYVRAELRGGFILDGYRPNRELLEQVARRLPRAHLLVVSAGWCRDCRREVPRLAAVLGELPDWSVELRGHDEQTAHQLGVRAIPTIVVLDRPGGQELGRVVESPESGSLEADLLAIAERQPARAGG